MSFQANSYLLSKLLWIYTFAWLLSKIIIHLKTYFVNAFTGIQKSYFTTFLLQKLKSSSQGLEAILDDLGDQSYRTLVSQGRLTSEIKANC